VNVWQLPTEAVFGGRHYSIHTDYRDVLEIFSYFEDPDLPDYVKWRIALALFFEEEIPPVHRQEAMAFLSEFLTGGKGETASDGPKLLDWEQDGCVIAAEINKVAGQEIRALPFVVSFSASIFLTCSAVYFFFVALSYFQMTKSQPLPSGFQPEHPNPFLFS